MLQSVLMSILASQPTTPFYKEVSSTFYEPITIVYYEDALVRVAHSLDALNGFRVASDEGEDDERRHETEAGGDVPNGQHPGPGPVARDHHAGDDEAEDHQAQPHQSCFEKNRFINEDGLNKRRLNRI